MDIAVAITTLVVIVLLLVQRDGEVAAAGRGVGSVAGGAAGGVREVVAAVRQRVAAPALLRVLDPAKAVPALAREPVARRPAEVQADRHRQRPREAHEGAVESPTAVREGRGFGPAPRVVEERVVIHDAERAVGGGRGGAGGAGGVVGV